MYTLVNTYLLVSTDIYLYLSKDLGQRTLVVWSISCVGVITTFSTTYRLGSMVYRRSSQVGSGGTLLVPPRRHQGLDMCTLVVVVVVVVLLIPAASRPHVLS